MLRFLTGRSLMLTVLSRIESLIHGPQRCGQDVSDGEPAVRGTAAPGPRNGT